MSRHTSRVTIVAILFLLTASFAAAEDGPALYKAKCAMCHAADGSGDTTMGKKLGLKPLSSAEVQKKTDAEITKTITDGKGKMPPFKKLTAGEVKAVVAAVRAFKK